MTLQPSSEPVAPFLSPGLSAEPQTAQPQTPEVLAKDLHNAALELFRQHRLTESQETITRALAQAETSVRWNDFATIAVARNDMGGAERGYRRAVELDTRNVRAATNLIVLLESVGKVSVAARYRHHHSLFQFHQS